MKVKRNIEIEGGKRMERGVYERNRMNNEI